MKFNSSTGRKDNPQSPKIVMKNPCHLKWEDLDGKGNGKHCQTCATQVVDFTNMSDEEIIAFISSKNERVCGNVRQNQLHATIQQNRKPYYFFKSLLWVALGLSSSALAQTPPKQVTALPLPYTLINKLPKPSFCLEVVLSSDIRTYEISVRGIVTDADNKNKPLAQATVVLKATQKGVLTNQDGTFEFKFDSSLHTDQPLILHVRYLGYTTQELVLTKEASQHFEVFLDPETLVVGELDAYQKSNLWERFKSLFKRKNKSGKKPKNK